MKGIFIWGLFKPHPFKCEERLKNGGSRLKRKLRGNYMGKILTKL
jgi:hypothetical protein